MDVDGVASVCMSARIDGRVRKSSLNIHKKPFAIAFAHDEEESRRLRCCFSYIRKNRCEGALLQWITVISAFLASDGRRAQHCEAQCHPSIMVRQSKRLKVAAEKAVGIATSSSTTAATAQSSTRTKNASVVAASKETVAAAAPGVVLQEQETRDESTSIRISGSSGKTGKKAGSNAAKDAWGALFANKRASTVAKQSARVQPKSAQAVTPETQAKIDGYAKFDGLTDRRAGTKCKIAAWNVNGLRALLKKEDSIHMRAYLAQEDPDVFCLSETKIDKDELQKVSREGEGGLVATCDHVCAYRYYFLYG